MPNYIVEFNDTPEDENSWVRNDMSAGPYTKFSDALAEFNREISDDYWSVLNFRINVLSSTEPNAVDPAHYQKLDPEPIDVIEKWGLNFRLSNVIKYIARHGRKPGQDAASDLRKARNYLNREINAIDGFSDWEYRDSK